MSEQPMNRRLPVPRPRAGGSYVAAVADRGGFDWKDYFIALAVPFTFAGLVWFALMQTSGSTRVRLITLTPVLGVVLAVLIRRWAERRRGGS